MGLRVSGFNQGLGFKGFRVFRGFGFSVSLQGLVRGSDTALIISGGGSSVFLGSTILGA